MSVEKPTLDDHIRWICKTSIDDGKNHIKAMLKDRGKRYTDEQLREALEAAIAHEIHTSHRKSLIVALRSAIKQVTPEPTGTRLNHETGLVELTHEQPKDPRWDQVRETTHQMTLAGRVFLRCQVKLGMLLWALKKEFGHVGSGRRNKVPESGTFLPWADLVKQETNYSRQSCDEFIRYWEATKAKLKTAKKLDLPAAAKKDALVLFQVENPLTLTDAQWQLVDQVIGTLTTGETQASLLAHLGIVPKPKPMPIPKGGGKGKGDNDMTAGQLAFHFFSTIADPLINCRTNPDYKKLLYALPVESDEDHPLSLSSIEAEARALIADIDEAKRKNAKPAKGRTVNV